MQRWKFTSYATKIYRSRSWNNWTFLNTLQYIIEELKKFVRERENISLINVGQVKSVFKWDMSHQL